MNWEIFAQITASILLALIGWFVAYQHNKKIEIANKRRDLRLEYLLDVYRRLQEAFDDPSDAKAKSKLENAISDIQLFGNDEQLNLSREFVNDFAEGKNVPRDPLMNSLRDDLRKELQLSDDNHPIKFFKIETLRSNDND